MLFRAFRGLNRGVGVGAIFSCCPSHTHKGKSVLFRGFNGGGVYVIIFLSLKIDIYMYLLVNL